MKRCVSFFEDALFGLVFTQPKGTPEIHALGSESYNKTVACAPLSAGRVKIRDAEGLSKRYYSPKGKS